MTPFLPVSAAAKLVLRHLKHGKMLLSVQRINSMKVAVGSLSFALVALSANAAPTVEDMYQSARSQIRFGSAQSPSKDDASRSPKSNNVFGDVLSDAGNMVTDVVESLDSALEDVMETSERAMRKLTHQRPRPSFDDSVYEFITHPDFEEYQIRLKSPKLCDPDVKQYSGYLDISSKRHLFFWFFESRSKPDSDPLVMWLNGGPGCSSSTGLLFELGPCTVSDNGNTTVRNPNSWNSNANMVFLDQPVQVGYSWSDGESVSNSADAAKDVYAFLQLFYKRFPEYRKLDFSLAAESYGGHYAPNIGSYVHNKNKESDQGLMKATKEPMFKIPLTSLLIGNGLTDPRVQFAAIPDFACEPAPTAVFSNSTCDSIRSKVPTCQRLQGFCYDNESRFSCVPATLYCWNNLAGPIQSTDINPYDVRKKCDTEAGDLCYKEMGWMETFLNNPEVKETLGAPSEIEFESCNMQVNQAFSFAGDNMHNSAALLPPMIADGIRVMIYAGDQDFMCNWIGNKQWVLGLNSTVQDELNSGKDVPFIVDGRAAGEVRRGGKKGAGQFTYIRIFDSGHMVPHDQPKAAVEMFNRWLANKSLGDE